MGEVAEEAERQGLAWVCTGPSCKHENFAVAECESCNSWICQQSGCGNLNFSSRETCNKKGCDAERPGKDEIYDQTYAFITTYVENQKNRKMGMQAKMGMQSKNGNAGGGNMNNGGGNRGSGMKGGGGNSRGGGGREGDWNCPRCGNSNYGSRDICNIAACGYAKNKWNCESCGNNNFEGRFLCNRCQKPHPAATARHTAEHNPNHGKGPGSHGGGQMGGGNRGGGQTNRAGPYNNQQQRPSNFGPPRDQHQQMGYGAANGHNNNPGGMFTTSTPQQPPVTFQPLLNADGSPMFINGQQVYVAAPVGH